MALAKKNTFRLSLALGRAIGLCVFILLLSSGSGQAEEPTMCGQWYTNKLNSRYSKRTLDWTHRVNAPHTQTGMTILGLRLKTPYPPDLDSSEGQSICSDSFKDSDIAACVWGGMIVGKRVGWLTKVDERNCFRSIQIQVHRPPGSREAAPVVTMPVRDGCVMSIPALDSERGCQALTLTTAAFRALGVSPEERANALFSWDFTSAPI